MLDLSRACAVVRSFDDVQGYRLGPPLLSPLRSPIDLWTPPPSPQASVTGLFPHRASLYVSNWTAGSLMDGAVPPPSAGLVSNWRVHTAMRMERHVARSVRMSTLSNQLNKLELQHSTHAFERDEPQFLDSPLSRLPNLSEIETNFDTSALHTVSQKSLATRPSFESSLETLQSDALEDGILTPIFGVLPKDPLDALDALEALAELQPVGYIASGKKHVDAIEALLGLQRPHDVHPFRTDQKRSQLYAESEWYEVPPPLPPKDTYVLHLPAAQRRSLGMVKKAGVAATHRRADSAPIWPQDTSSKPKRPWCIGHAPLAHSATTAWRGTDQVQIKHFHHHHYHHQHAHYRGRKHKRECVSYQGAIG